MLSLEWPPVLSLLAHELRTPSAVISGYARMLKERRLDEPASARALQQIESASAVLGRLAGQASSLADWLTPREDAKPHERRLAEVLGRAVRRAAAPDAVDLDIRGDADRRVMVIDDTALETAFAMMADQAARDARDGRARIIARDGDAPATCDVIVAPGREALPLPSPAGSAPPEIGRGGLGLGVVLALAVLDAHGARCWTAGDSLKQVGITFPTAS